MESENVKRSSLVKTPKPTSLAVVEGTSVTPRQRPKGQVVTTGPISLSGQIVGQISGQGNQVQSQSCVGNAISYVQMGQQLTSLNTSQAYLGQTMPANVASLPVSAQVPPHQISAQSPLSQVAPQNSSTTSQNVSFVQQPQGQQPQCSTIRQSPVIVQDTVSPYYFDTTAATNVNDENLEALFPPSGKEIYNANTSIPSLVGSFFSLLLYS